MNSFNPVLHGLRGLAACAVVLFHWQHYFPMLARKLEFVNFAGITLNLSIPIHFGWLGVPLFFVLSGYLLGSQLANRDLSAKFVIGFWKRRFLRIYPAAWVQLITLIAINEVLPGIISPFSSAELLRNILLYVNLPPWMTTPINEIWWTLPVELGFYILLPFMILLAKKFGWFTVLILSLGLTISWRAGVIFFFETQNYSQYLIILDSIPGSLATFACGMSIAFLNWNLTGMQRRLFLLILMASFFGMQYWLVKNVGAYWSGHWILAVWNPMMAVIISLSVFCMLQPIREIRFLTSRPLIWLGEISFGIYLWHYPIQRMLLLIWPGAWETQSMSALALVLSFSLTLPLAALSFYSIESKVMGWGKV